MRRIVAEAIAFFKDQIAMMDLTARVAACAATGHQDGMTIEFKNRLQRVCPRCGRELE